MGKRFLSNEILNGHAGKDGGSFERVHTFTEVKVME